MMSRRRLRRIGLNAQMIVDRLLQLLLAAEVTLRGLNRYVAEQKLDLFEFAATEMTQSSAGSPEIMRGNVLDPSPSRRCLNHLPNHLGGHAATAHAATLVDGAEYSSPANPRCLPPIVKPRFDPSGHRYSTDVSALPHEIGDDPVALSQLQILPAQLDRLGSAETTS